MQSSLEGKVALITGAGSGLGEATARVFAREGCSVACVDIRQEAAERVSSSLNGDHLACGCDVSDAEAVFRTVDSIVQRFGRLDVAVNCAAIDHTLWVHEMTVEQWDQVIAVNLRGPFLVCKAVLPVMRSQRSGHIVNISSTAGIRAWTGASAYHASKWGLIGFSRGLGVEGRDDGVRVTTIIPGGMRTGFFDRFVDQDIPMPELANLQDPANVARVILFAVRMPAGSEMQEVIVTPTTETSWP